MTPEQRIVSREVTAILGKLSRRDAGLLIEFMSSLSKAVERERARVAELDRAQKYLDGLPEHADVGDDCTVELAVRVAELDKMLTDALKNMNEAISNSCSRAAAHGRTQGQLEITQARVEVFEKRDAYQERCEDELQWWRQTHTDEEPPGDIWDEGEIGETARLKARVEELESGAAWRRIDGPGIDGQRVMLRELDPFDKYNRGDENRDAIASGYWSDECRYFVWPFGCTDHPPTHWSPMPDRLSAKSGEGKS